MVAGINHGRFLMMAAALMAASHGPPMVVDVEARRRRQEGEDRDVLIEHEARGIMNGIDLYPVSPKPAPDSRGQAALMAAEAKRARRNAKRLSPLPSSTVPIEE